MDYEKALRKLISLILLTKVDVPSDLYATALFLRNRMIAEKRDTSETGMK